MSLAHGGHSSFCSSSKAADEPDDGTVIGKDADDIGAVLAGEIHVGEHVGFGRVEHPCELGQARAHLVGNRAPLLAGRSSSILDKGSADPDENDPLLRFAGLDQGQSSRRRIT